MGIAQSRGNAAETLAVAYLELIGFRVLARNVCLAGVEVDIVAADGPVRAVTEVKYRGRTDYGGAAPTVDRAKQQRLRRAASALECTGTGAVRIDVVAIELSQEGAILRHYRNAVVD